MQPNLLASIQEVAGFLPEPPIDPAIVEEAFKVSGPVPAWAVITRTVGGTFSTTVPLTDWSRQFTDGTISYVKWEHPTRSGLLRLNMSSNSNVSHFAVFQFDSKANYEVTAYISARTWGKVQIGLNGNIGEFNSNQTVSSMVRGNPSGERNIVTVAMAPGTLDFELMVQLLDGQVSTWPAQPSAVRPRPDGVGANPFNTAYPDIDRNLEETSVSTS